MKPSRTAVDRDSDDRIGRRKVILGTGALAAALAGCGGSEGTPTPPATETPTDTPTETPPPTETPTPTPTETPMSWPKIPKASSAPTLDGTLDDSWSAANTWQLDPINSEQDRSGELHLMWDDAAIYVFGDMVDDAIYTDDELIFRNDTQTFMFNPNDDDENTTEGQHYIYFKYGNDEAKPIDEAHRPEIFTGDVSGIEFTHSETDDGYHWEAKIPWATLGVSPSAGQKHGLNIRFNENDPDESRIIQMWPEDQPWDDPSSYNTVELVE